jgi:predicted dehydrogenase
LDQYLYFEDVSSGANLLTIAGGHTLDLIESLAGNIVDVDARTAILWPNPNVMDTGATATRENPDHVSVLGKTSAGAVFSADILGGVSPEHPKLVLEVRGSEGWVKLSGGHPYGFQAGDLTLTSSAEFDTPDAPVVTGGLQNAALNVGEVYASIVRDIEDGSHSAPDFGHALHNSRLMAAVRQAGEGGHRTAVPR